MLWDNTLIIRFRPDRQIPQGFFSRIDRRLRRKPRKIHVTSSCIDYLPQGHNQSQHPESSQTHSKMHPKVLLQIMRG